MKRTLIPGLMLLAAFTLTNCSEQLVPPVQEDDVIVEETPSTEATEEEILGIPFEVYANASDEELETKTTNVNGDDKTSWELEDAIYVYHAPAGSTGDFTKHYKFKMRDLEENLFGGALAANTTLLADKSYDWYFIYPNNEDGSGSASTGNTKVSTKVVIGAEKGTDDKYVQNVSDVNEKTAGIYYPMYGKATTLGEQNPKVKMKHLSSLIALKVVNQGDSPKEDLTANRDGNEKNILIKELTFSVPSVTAIGSDGKSGKQTSLPIVGAFTVDITGNPEYTEIKNESSHTVTLKLPREIEIEPGNDATFYLAVRPFDARSIDRSTNLPDPILEVTINGSKRQVTIPAGKAKFEAGKVTTLRVPVKLDHPKRSGATSGKPFEVKMPVSTQPVNVNGEIVDAYIVPNGKSLTIKGTVRDLINAFDAGFYASCWQGKKAAMTVTKINLEMPNYKNGTVSGYTPIGSYGPLINELETIVKKIVSDAVGGGIGGWIAAGGAWLIAEPILKGMLAAGISRDSGLIKLTQFMDPSTITFVNIIENGATDAAQTIIIMDESPIFKEVGETQVNNLLSERFAFGGYTPVFNELKAAALNGECNKTIETIYNKLENRIGDESFDLEGVGEFKVWPIFAAIFPNAETMASILGDLKVSVDIGTCTYPGLEALDENAATYPVVFWGINSDL